MPKKNLAKKDFSANYNPQKKLLWLLIFSPLLFIITMLLFAGLGDLPGTEELENPDSNLATEIISSDSKVLGKFFKENRTDIKFQDLSPHLVNALTSTEDERFYTHNGVDIQAIARVAKGVLTANTSQGGGSTITQQLAKMLFPREDLSTFGLVMRKFKEWLIAIKLERQYTKDEIIAMYLNKFDWVHNAVGIKSAAQVYFNTVPDSLRIEQAAMLIGMAKNPSLFDPIKRPEQTKLRREVVLSQMKKNGYLTQEKYDSLRIFPLGLDYKMVDHKEGLAPYFREVLRGEVAKLLASKTADGKLIYHKPDGQAYNLYSDGLKIYTTIDTRLQKYAEQAVETHLKSELQPQFFKDVARWKNPPFSNDLSDQQVDKVIKSAMERSDRFRFMTGKACGNCNRTKSITKTTKDGIKYYHCTAEDCDNYTRIIPEDSITIIFNKKTKMKVFTYRGERDTILSPIDSILYYKSFLQSGLISIDPHTGFVKAWVGGINYNHFKYDHVMQGKRQVGSTFKPFVYALAIREGYSPCFEVPKVPTTFHSGTFNLNKDYTPTDSDNDYGYMVSLKYGLANSINTVTAWVMKQFGPEAVIKLAKDLGVKSKLDPVVSQCFGVADLSVMEITSANATFANKGVHIDPIYITRIEDKNGNPIYEVTPITNEALDEKTAYIMLNLMKGTVDGVYNEAKGKSMGTAVRLRMDLPSRGYDGISKSIAIAGKTGTTQNQSDGWFIGLTPDLVTGVWVGAEDRSVRFKSLALGMGTNMALPIWGYYMKKAWADNSVNISKGDFEKPNLPLGLEIDCNTFKAQSKEFSDDQIQW
jgi:penicillin-binding protein 1A